MGPMIAREIAPPAGRAPPVGALAVSAEVPWFYALAAGPLPSALLPAERRSKARRRT
jgi:hypothetical protein